MLKEAQDSGGRHLGSFEPRYKGSVSSKIMPPLICANRLASQPNNLNVGTSVGVLQSLPHPASNAAAIFPQILARKFASCTKIYI